MESKLIILLSLLILFLHSCNEIEERKKNFSELKYKYDVDDVLITENGKIYQYFDFIIIDHHDSIKKDSLEFSSIRINFPLNDTIFSNHYKQNCLTIYTHKKGNIFKSDTINDGVIDGVKLQNGFWKLNIVLNQLEFEGILSSLKENKMDNLKLKIK